MSWCSCPPPPDVWAGAIEDELASLDQKIQSGGASPADVQRYNDLLQMLQDQERKKPKNDFLKPRFRLNGHGQFQQGFGMTMNTPPAQTGTCGELKNIYYDCAVLPWDATDGWTRTDEIGTVTVRQCTRDDDCVSDGILAIDSNEGLLFWRVEEGIRTERHASVTFRMRETVSEKNPDPYTTLFGGGVVWLDDGVKASVIGFGEDIYGDRVVVLAIEGHPDPETGELGITEVLTAYHDWSVWRDYRLVRDAEGMVELLVDDDPTPVVSFPYASLNMESLGGPAVLFGNLIEGQNSRVVLELDYLNYSVGMPNAAGFPSSDGKLTLLYAINDNKSFDPSFDRGGVAVKLSIDIPKVTAGGSAQHTYLLRAVRVITDEAGHVIRTIVEDRPIGPLGVGGVSEYVVSATFGAWNGKNDAGELAPAGTYQYTLALSIVRVDVRGKEKVISSGLTVSGSITVSVSEIFPRVLTDQNLSSFFLTYLTVETPDALTISMKNCSTGAEPILDVFYDRNSRTGPYTKAITSHDYEFPKECRLERFRYRCEKPVGAYVSLGRPVGETVMVVVKAKDHDKAGRCRFTAQNGPYVADWIISFAGERITWYTLAGDEVQDAPLTNHDTLMVFADPVTFAVRDSQTNPAYDDDSGVGKASRLRSNQEGMLVTYIGTKLLVEGAVSNVYRNDTFQDADGDGLGDLLEPEIGTCKTNTGTNKFGFDCSKSLENGKDTDGDGLRDYWEVFGVPHAANEPKSHDLDLPALGASPLFKDVFIEVDFWEHPGLYDHRVRPEAIQAINTFFRYQPIANPNLQTGINVVVVNDSSTGCDGDVCPNSPAGITNLCFPTSTCQPCNCDSAGVCTVDRECLKPLYFTPNRLGVFHWFLSVHGNYIGNGYIRAPTATVGSCFVQTDCPPLVDQRAAGCCTRDLGMGEPRPDHDLFVQYATILHELGHNMGLDHGGFERNIYKPNYPSLMNYSYAWSFNQSHRTLAGTQIKFSAGRFIDKPTTRGLDENHLCEAVGLDTNDDAEIGFLSTDFHVGESALLGYRRGAVDWNQNWIFEDACVGNPSAGSVQQNFDDDPTLTKLNDCDNFEIIARDMAGGLYADQGTRFAGDYVRPPPPIQPPERIVCFE